MRRHVDRLRHGGLLAAGLVGALVGLLVLLVFLAVRSPRESVILEVQPDPAPNELQVWVGGQVVQPGLYTLSRGARVADAIEAAGGLLEHADASGLGMAATIEDADQIIVPEAERAAALPGETSQSVAPTVPVTAGLININTATAALLEELPGIGPALAGRIIEYRELNGPFQNLEELAEVSGISDRMVTEMAALITVGT